MCSSLLLFGLGCWFAVECVVLVVMYRFCAGFHGVLVCFGFSLVLVWWSGFARVCCFVCGVVCSFDVVSFGV